MTIISNVEIDRPLARVMELMADAANSKKWMHDLESYVPAKNGHNAQLSFKNGAVSMIFTLSPLPSGEPNELHSKLEGKNMTINTVAYFRSISPQKTALRFEQDFEFRGLGKIMGLVARPAIEKQQNKHMQDFKSFAESES